MNFYSIALFLHVCGDVGIFIGLGTQLLSLMALRRAQYVEMAIALALSLVSGLPFWYIRRRKGKIRR